MKTGKRLPPLILALAMTFTFLPTVWADDIAETNVTTDSTEPITSEITTVEETETDTEPISPEDTTAEEADTSNDSAEPIPTEDTEETISEESSAALYSVLRSSTSRGMTSITGNVTIDRSTDIPGGLKAYEVTVGELLSKILGENNLLTDGKYDGLIAYSLNYNFENVSITTDWNEVITLPEYSSGQYGCTVYFVLGADQFDPDSQKVEITATYKTPFSIIDFKFFEGPNGAEVTSTPNYISGYYRSFDIMKSSFSEGSSPCFLMDNIPAGCRILSGGADITEAVTYSTGNTACELDSYYSDTWGKNLTAIVKNYNGEDISFSFNLYVDLLKNNVSIGSKWVSEDDFDSGTVTVKATYNDYTESPSVNPITFACFGTYSNLDTAKANDDIKDSLFGTGVSVDLSQYNAEIGTYQKTKTVPFTVFDTYGGCYNVDAYFYMNTYTDGLSDDTYFNVTGAKKDNSGSKTSLSSFRLSGSDDSYFQNGYQTIFLLDSGSPFTDNTIYPVFHTSSGAVIHIDNALVGSDVTTDIQTSGESSITFANGRPVQYSAASESGKCLKNYWVTFLTRQNGAKLFVNAANNPDHYSDSGNPQRVVILDAAHKYRHDIAIANIGDTELTGINVTLNASGVKLDDYWRAITGTKGKLPAFTDTSSSNVAKIRLLPEDEDSFAPISGQLVISADNGDSVTIDLTGIAGTPKIVTDDVFNGVKYVPYSCLIQTNSMSGNDGMTFSVSSGNLPSGLILNSNTGEIYGIPTETGSFTFTIKLVYTNSEISGTYTDTREYTINVKENTDENVDGTNEDEQGETLNERVSREITVYYSQYTDTYTNEGFIEVEKVEMDSDLFWSEGVFGDFKAFYIDGRKLAEGSDYTKEEGSTKITVQAQTFGNTDVTASDVPHTLAAEFRTSDGNEMSRSAQNVYITYVPAGSGDDDGSGGSGTNPGGSGDNPGGSGDNPGGTGSNPGGSGSNPGSSGSGAPIATTTSPEPTGSVTLIMTIADKEQNPAAGLALELHSKTQKGKTDSSGQIKFNSVEFGKHKLYVLDDSGKKTASQSFSIVSGKTFGLKGNVITVQDGTTVSLVLEYDGNDLKILSMQEDVSSGAGAYVENTADLVIEKNGIGKVKAIVLFLVVLVIGGIGAAATMIKRERKGK